jgi:hypothetical protein
VAPVKKALPCVRITSGVVQALSRSIAARPARVIARRSSVAAAVLKLLPRSPDRIVLPGRSHPVTVGRARLCRCLFPVSPIVP